MTNIDQFESVFKAADKPAFVPETIKLDSVLTITTLAEAEGQAFQQAALDFLASSAAGRSLKTHLVNDGDFTEVRQLLEIIETEKPDLICTYRNLKRPSADYPFSLGVFVDVLTQATAVPVLLLPTPNEWLAERGRAAQRVMAITDHLTGDHHLVSFAAHFAAPEAKLWLAHVEDEATFQRIIETIAKIPSIDTETAAESIMEQLLKEPHDYISSCKGVLGESAAHLEVCESVTIGHRLFDYKQLVEQHQIDLVVMNTKDEDQLAMHGLAYPLTIELRRTPLLLL